MKSKKIDYIILRGPLGCGKSTISSALAKILHAKYISIDRIVDNPKLVTREIEKGYISQKNFFKANEIAVKKIKKGLEAKRLVIFDGNFYWKSQITDLIKRLKRYNGKVFTLKASVKTCIQRDSNREKSCGKIAAKVVHKKSTSFKYGYEIKTENKSIKEIVRSILGKLR